MAKRPDNRESGQRSEPRPQRRVAVGDLPWSRRIAVQSVSRKGLDLTLEADEQALSRIAASLELIRLDALTAHFALRLLSGDIMTVTGKIVAAGQQPCVVSLEPVPFAITEPVEQRYASDAVLPRPTKAEIERSLDDPDPPEPFDDGMVDVAALAVETLSLALPPFPRAPDAAHAAPIADDTASPGRDSPFAALGLLKGKT